MKTSFPILIRLEALLWLLSSCLALTAKAQFVDPQTGEMLLHPFPPEVQSAEVNLWDKITPEFLRKLPDYDPLLSKLYLRRIRMEETTSAVGMPVADMVEKDMWRRGDVAVEMVKKLFAEPPTDTTQYLISIWLRYRPWMKPDEFVPLARQIYAAHTAQPESNHKSTTACRAMVELFARWGEPQDEETVAKHVKKQLAMNQSPSKHKMWLVFFKERQALRARGDPRGMPAWFYDKREGIKSAIPNPLKTYEEIKIDVRNPQALSSPLTKQLQDVSSQQGVENPNPPWLIIGGAFVTLIALLFTQSRLRRKD